MSREVRNLVFLRGSHLQLDDIFSFYLEFGESILLANLN